MDNDGVLYFGLIEPLSIMSWNTSTNFSPHNFNQIAVNGELLPISFGMKVVNNPKGHQELWLMTTNLYRTLTRTLTPDRINFIIHAGDIPAFQK